MLRFGRDLDVELARELRATNNEPKLYSFENGRLSAHSRHSSQLRFRLRNKGLSERTVSVALNVVHNAQIQGADEAAYDTALGRGIVSFQLPAQVAVNRDLQIVEGVRTPIEPAQVTSQFLKGAAAQSSVDKAQRAILLRAGERLYLAETRRGALPKRKLELADALTDSTRLESHVRALGQGSSEGRLAARRLRETEEQLSQLRRRIASLTSEIAEFESQSSQLLSSLGEAKPVE